MNSGTLARFILIALVFLLPFTSSAQNTPHTVNSYNALQNAIQSANVAISLDTINITSDITIAFDINTIFSEITINGNGHTIYGADTHSAITTSGSHVNLTINNLTLAENQGATGNHGGAILHQGGSLTLNNVTIRDSATAAADADGGGLICAGSNTSLTIKNSRIHGNSGNEGGGIYLGNGCTGAQIINSSIYDNTSTGNGGGIHVAAGASVIITGSRIYGNTAGTTTSAKHGGGIYAYGSSSSAAIVNINSSSIYNNEATGEGGGAYIGGQSTFNMNGSAVYGNEVRDSGSGGNGGGLALRNEPNSPATHTINNSTIFGNTVVARGGGIYASMNSAVGTTSRVNLWHVTITGNSSSLTHTLIGGGMYVAAVKLTLQNSIIHGNIGNNNASNCIFDGLNPIGHSSGLGPVLANNIVGAGSSELCKTNSDPADPLLAGPSVHGQGSFFIPRVGSPAIDTIGNADCLSTMTTDQRGRARPYPTGGNCDKGAIEDPGWSPPPPPSSPDGGDDGDDGDGGNGSSSASSTSSGDDEANQAAVAVIRYLPAQSCQTLQPEIVVSKASSGTSCQRVQAEGIGHPDVIAANPGLVVDIWGWVTPGTQVCFRADSGAIKFIDTTMLPRTVADLPVFSEAGGLLCATIDGAGQVALVAGPPAPPVATATLAADKLSGCMVRTQYMLNFRAAPDGEIIDILPFNIKLTAMERSAGFFKVDYMGAQGWVSEDLVELIGTCG